MLCGKARCPVMARAYSGMKTAPLIDKMELDGSTPPTVFIGRFGYPKVNIGPMLPPFHGDTAYMDTPEEWVGRPIKDIIDFRSSLVRGMYQVGVRDVHARDPIVELTQEIALARKAVDVEVKFGKKPAGTLTLNAEAQPHGPKAPLVSAKAGGNIYWDRRLEKAHYDTDLRAAPAVVDLYENEVLVSRIQKAFSVGAFGEKRRRKFVPTRWSITAVDSILGENLMQRTRLAPLIDEYRVYETEHLDNRWAVLFMPTEWCFELIEAWYPNTLWNPHLSGIQIFSDWERHSGRKDYAKIGGCYYASRLAVNELLTKERRQAGAVIFREAHPGYILPVGVWNVRENVRAALRNEPARLNTLQDALGFIMRRMDIPLRRWIRVSGVLKDRMYQRRLEDFMRVGG